MQRRLGKISNGPRRVQCAVAYGCDLADDVATASNGRSRFEYLQRRAVRSDGENVKWGSTIVVF